MRPHRASRVLAPAALCLALPLTGCGDDGPTPQAEPSTPTSSSRPSKQGPAASPRPEKPAGSTLSITVTGDDVSPMGRTISLSAGETVTVRITSDRPGELHVHTSPEQYVEFGAGKTRQEVRLDKPGQVDVEEHDTGALVARLLVQ